MNLSSLLTVKIATEPWEFEQIHALNHQTFAEEIPQHPANDSARLVDRFHGENTYVIGLCGRRLTAMMAVRDRRPFSLDQRVPDLDAYLPPGRSMCELRLLAVEKGSRAGGALPALLDFVWRHCLMQGYDLALISAVTTQLKLYRHLGFEAFGPLTGAPGAQFQPMLLTLERFATRAPRVFRQREPLATTANFLPGPVTIDERVAEALRRPPVSHRSPAFLTLIESVKAGLCRLVDADRVELLLGSGTMANDVVAAQLTLERAPGVVLSNGEFGARLQDHARRAGLSFDTIEAPWSASIDPGAVASYLAREPSCRWLWLVHCETSTGVLNDLPAIRSMCTAAGVKLCVDAISSIGTVPVSLAGVYLATGVSGKGLGSYPGVAMVFYDHDLSPASTGVPRSLDLGHYAREGGVPFTHSSNLLRALDTALRVEWPARFRELSETSTWLRMRLASIGFDIVGSGEPSPAVVTIALPGGVSSVAVAIELERQGHLVSANSRYLIERNWIQICPMGSVRRDELSAVTTALVRTCSDHGAKGFVAAGVG